MPLIGEKLPDYPGGYGFCQCGCGSRTELLDNGVYPKYVNATHHPSDKQKKHSHQPQSFRSLGENANSQVRELPQQVAGQNEKYGVVDELAQRYLNLVQRTRKLEMEVQHLKLRLEFAVSFINRCWSGDPMTKEVLIRRLQAASLTENEDQVEAQNFLESLMEEDQSESAGGDQSRPT